MTRKAILMVRIYLTERRAHLERLVRHLHDVERVGGLTVFRAVAGFGQSGHVHSAELIDTATNLPLVVEFFDEPERARAVIEQLRGWLPPSHIVSWDATQEQDHPPRKDRS